MVDEPVYAYDQENKGFNLFPNKQAWIDLFNVSGAISYLKDDLQKSLNDDFYPAYEAFQKSITGFYALPRIIFPYITFLGTLSGGKDSSANAINYMNKYMSKVNPTYEDKKLCEFIYKVYRHGLAHTNMPKIVFENNTIVGWRIVFYDEQHLFVDRNPGISGKDMQLSISPKRLAKEVSLSIDEYIKDLRNGGASFEKFKKGFLSMAEVLKCLLPDCIG